MIRHPGETVSAKGYALLFLYLVLIPFYGLAQQRDDSGLTLGIEEGIRIDAPDSTLGLRFELRLQTQVYADIALDEAINPPVESQVHALLRRARFRFKGYLLKGMFTYFGQLEFDRGRSYISDARIEWHPNGQMTFGAGQFKLFENRQNRMSSASLQFVDRSEVSGFFTQSYDVGGYWKGEWVPEHSLGVKTYLAVTQGELRNNPTASGGFLYNGRIEVLPFGAFTSDDYVSSALTPEPSPKLSVGAAASFNKDAYTLYGNNFPDTYGSDVTTIYTDYLFKYRRFSSMGEFIWRGVENEVLRLPGTGQTFVSGIAGGYGFFIQGGFMLLDNLGLAARYGKIHPEADDVLKQLANDQEKRYSLGLNHYIHKHNIKIQGDVTLVDRLNRAAQEHFRYVETRVQFQINF